MGIFSKYVVFVFLLALLTQCRQKRHDNIDTNLKIDLTLHPILNSTPMYPQLHATSYVGEWSYAFPFYGSELTINKDGTFKFHERGCTGDGYSEGKWTNYGSAIVLNSFDKYFSNKSPKVAEVKPKSIILSHTHKKHSAKIEYTLDPSIFNETATPQFSIGDTSNVYFDNVLMSLENDILYELDKNGFKTKTRFILTKNNR